MRKDSHFNDNSFSLYEGKFPLLEKLSNILKKHSLAMFPPLEREWHELTGAYALWTQPYNSQWIGDEMGRESDVNHKDQDVDKEIDAIASGDDDDESLYAGLWKLLYVFALIIFIGVFLALIGFWIEF